MENTLNKNAIKLYADQWAAKACNEFFSQKEVINGEEVKSFTKVKQVNYFILQELLELWNSEMEQLKSPYFDFDHEEVAQALKNFMNILSRHIAVSREHFEPLVGRGVYSTLVILFSPFDYFLEQIASAGEGKFSSEVFRKKNKYIVINADLAHAFANKIAEEQPADQKEAARLFEQVCTEIDVMPEDYTSYLSQLNELHQADPEEFLEENSVDKAKKSFEKDESKENSEPEKVFTHSFESIHLLQDAITLNQKFMFQKELFNEDSAEYHRVIKTIDELESYNDVVSFLKPYIEKYKWDVETEEVMEFFDLVAKRFKKG